VKTSKCTLTSQFWKNFREIREIGRGREKNRKEEMEKGKRVVEKA